MWGGLADRLQHDVAAAGTLERAIGALEAFLLQRFRVGRAADPVLRAAVAALMPWRPVEVGAVAAGVGLSESQLRRRALSAVGLSPKVLQRTLRFPGFLALPRPARRRAAVSAATASPDSLWMRDMPTRRTSAASACG